MSHVRWKTLQGGRSFSVSAQVFCPKCGRAQPAEAAGAGDHHRCVDCSYSFSAKGRPQHLPPQVLAGGAAALVVESREDPELPGRPRSMSNLPAPREAIPSPSLGIAPPAPGRTLAGLPFDAPPGAPPALPAGIRPPALPRSAAANLPAARESVPLPATSLANGSVVNLPAARESIALPNLPASRAAVPQPNLPVARSAAPRPGAMAGAPVALARINLGGGGEGGGGDRTPTPEVMTASSPLSALNLCGFSQGPPAALQGLDLDLSPDMDLPPTGGAAGGGRLRPNSTVLGMTVESAESPTAASLGLDLDLLGEEAPATTKGHGLFTPRYVPATAKELTGDMGLGFKLDIEGSSTIELAQRAPGIVPTSALPAIEVNSMGVLKDTIAELAPHRAQDDAPKSGSRRRPSVKVLAVVALGSLAVAAVVTMFVVPWFTKGTSPETVLAPFENQLNRDSFPSYKQASGALLQQAAIESNSDALRAQAAELLILTRVARNAPKAALTEAEQTLSQILQNPTPPEVERRARALLELAQGKPQRADPLLAGIEDSPGARVIIGLKQMAIGSPASAASTFEVAVSQQPNRLLPQFLLGKAYESAGQTKKAHAAFAKVAAANPQHLGAALGALRTQGLTESTLIEKLEKLGIAGAVDSSGAEVAAVYVLLGRTAAALGRTAIPAKAYAQALAADSSNLGAAIGLSETLLQQGRFNEALARVQGVSAEATKTTDGLFALGGAQIATHRAGEGLVLIEKAMTQEPRDPRGPFFKAWAAEEAVNPNLKTAEESYLEALKFNPKFVPASLRLAALLQRTNRAPESLKVLKAAEDAGAPAPMLQMAWGHALIVAKQPERAEDVFRKALATDPGLAPARLGLASALEAEGRVGEAKLELDELLVQSPETEGLRERLAGLALRLGEKDEAMSQYEAALASGKAGPEVQVAIGRLSLQTGNIVKAAKHLEKVVEEAPSTPGALFWLGQLREKQGELGKAIGEYRRATSYENTPEVQLAYGKVLNQAGKEDDAMVAFREAFALAEAHLEHGRILQKRAKPDKAIGDFTAAVGIDPEMVEAYLLMGNAHDSLGENDKAADSWRNAVRLQPKHTEALYKLGRLLMDRSQSKPALDYLRRASESVPEEKPWAADVFFQLGYAELQAGTKKNAGEALTKYLTLAPTDAPDRPAVEKQLERLK